MPKPSHRNADLIPFESVRRIVNERRQRARAASPDASGSGEDGLDAIPRTSQVRRILAGRRHPTPPRDRP